MKSVGKRGVSTIIATVMLILITLVAIFLLWFFLRPTIVSTDEKLGTAADCIKVRVEPVSCQYYRSNICLGTLVSVNARRAAGTGNYNGIDFLFTRQDGTKFVFNSSSFGLGFKETSNVKLNETEYGLYGKYFDQAFLPFENTVKSVNTAVLVGADRKTCDPLATEVKCVESRKVNNDVCLNFDNSNESPGLDYFDFTGAEGFTQKFKDHDPSTDFNRDGIWDIEDYATFCASFDARVGTPDELHGC